MLDNLFWTFFNKSAPLVLETLALYLVFKKPKVSSILIMSTIFVCILNVILIAGYFDLEFFFILLFLIYISALLVLFLFALLFLPVDKQGAEKRESSEAPAFCSNDVGVVGTMKTISSSIDISLLSFISYMSTRLVDIRSHYLNSFLEGNTIFVTFPFTFNYFQPGISSWSTSYEALNNLASSNLEAFTRGATSISAASYQEYFIALIAVVLALIMVLVGTLSWFKRTETLEN